MGKELVPAGNREGRNIRRHSCAQGDPRHAAGGKFVAALVVAFVGSGFVALVALGRHRFLPAHGADRRLCIWQGQHTNRQRGDEQSSDSVVFHV